MPPSEVQVAVAMARADSLRQSPHPFDHTSSSVSTAGLHLSTSMLSTISLDDTSSVGSPSAAGRPNGYSIGASLPKGVSWRYVDVLNQK